MMNTAMKSCFQDGRIYCDGEAICEDEFYRKRNVFCEILPVSSEGNAPVLKYRITWKNQTNTAFYSADSVVKLVNLELNGKDIIRRDLEGGAGTAEIPSIFTTQIRDIPAGNESASRELIENTVRGWKFEVGEMKGIHIGEVLVEQGAITKEQLNEGLKQLKAEANDRRLAEVLTDLGYITDGSLWKC